MRHPQALVLLTVLLLVIATGCEAETNTEVDTDTTATAVDTAGVSMTPGATGPAMVQVAQDSTLGEYLTDDQGRAVYLFMADSAKTQSSCYDACAQAWPPLLTQGEPQAGMNADSTLLGTIQRSTGEMQATYNGWPLYYFVQDQGAGQTSGQDVEGFGAEWYLVSPQGEPVHAE